MQIAKLDWELINSRVKNAKKNNSLSSESKGLLWIALQSYFPDQENLFQEIICDGSDDRGVDAIHIVGDDEFCTAYIFQSKYRTTRNNTLKTINCDEVLKITSFLDMLVNKSQILSKTNNVVLKNAINEIWRLHRNGVIFRYKIIFVSNDTGLHSSSEDILEEYTSERPYVSYEVYDSKCLLRDISRSRNLAEDGCLTVIGKEIFERSDGDIRGAIASVEAKSIIDLITEEPNLSIKRHLFDDNLRVFLGSNLGYNPHIIATASSDKESYLFWYLNNGITITCSNFNYNKGHSGPVISIKDIQIVNGAQTCHSLVEAYKNSPSSVMDACVTVKVFATSRDDIAERVAVATNSQARIQSRDLRANHPIMKKFEIMFLERGIYFERKRFMHSDKPESVKLDALKLGQIILVYYAKEPEMAKTASDQIFDTMFNTLFNEHYDFDELNRVISFYRYIESARDKVKLQYENRIESSGDFQYLIYGHWFVLFAARILLDKNEEKMPSESGFRTLLNRSVELVARTCRQTKQVAHYQMFRSPKTKEKIMAELSGTQLSLNLLFDDLLELNDPTDITLSTL